MTSRRALDMGMDSTKYLKDNDSYSFFKKPERRCGKGPTGTNVNDVMILGGVGEVREGRTEELGT